MTKADEGVALSVRCATYAAGSGVTGGVTVSELTHDLVRGQISEYVDGTLGEGDRRRLAGHLEACPPCAAYLNTLRATVDGLGKLSPPKAPAGVRRRILDQAREQALRESTSKP